MVFTSMCGWAVLAIAGSRCEPGCSRHRCHDDVTRHVTHGSWLSRCVTICHHTTSSQIICWLTAYCLLHTFSIKMSKIQINFFYCLIKRLNSESLALLLLDIEFTTYWIFMPFNLTIFFWPSIKFMASFFVVISALISFQYLFPFQMLIPPNRTRSLSSPMSPNSMMSSPTRLPAIPCSMPRPRGNSNNLKSLPPPSTCGSGSTSL